MLKWLIVCLIVNCQEGHSALYHAAAGGHTEAVRLLITAGADINQRDQVSTDAL